MTDTRELIAKELERAALASGDALAAARAELKRITGADAKRAQSIKIAGLAAEHSRCLQALFTNNFAKARR